MKTLTFHGLFYFSFYFVLKKMTLKVFQKTIKIISSLWQLHEVASSFLALFIFFFTKLKDFSNLLLSVTPDAWFIHFFSSINLIHACMCKTLCLIKQKITRDYRAWSQRSCSFRISSPFWERCVWALACFNVEIFSIGLWYEIIPVVMKLCVGGLHSMKT